MEFLGTVLGLVAFIFILGLIIAVHEGGHFFFARRAGILAREFAFGMGPILWKKKKGETVYSVRAFPIGGFCAIAGEELEDDPFKDRPRVKLDIKNEVIHGFYLNVENDDIKLPVYDIMEYDIFDQEETGNLYMEVIREGERFKFSVDPQAMVYLEKLEYQIAPYNRTLGAKSKRARAMVMFGGPLMNFLLAILAFFIFALMRGFPNTNSNKVSGMDEDNPTLAYEAGLRNNDKITKLKSGNLELVINAWDDISNFMASYTNAGKITPIEVEYVRNNQTATTNVLPSILFSSLAIEGQIHYVNNNPVGIKVLNYISASDGMINNSALEKYYTKELIITKFNNIEATNLGEVFALLNNFQGNNEMDALNKIELTILSDGETATVKVQPYSKAIMDYQMKTNGIPVVKVAMGISPSYKFNFLKSIGYGFTETLNSSTAVFSTLKMLFTRIISVKSLSSFVGIGAVTVKLAKQGILPLLHWLGLLSVNIGLMNLLPIPALDGGRLVFLGYEAITKKKPNQKVETWLIGITMLLLFGLMIFVTINEILRIF